MSYVFLNLGYPSGDLTIFYGKWSMYRWIDDLWWFSLKNVIFYDKITTWYLNYITSGLSVGPSLSTSGAVYDWWLGDRLQWRCFLLAQCPDRMAFPLVHLLKSPVETNMATLHPDNLRSRQTLPSFCWLHCLGCIVLLRERSAYVLRRAGCNVQLEQNIVGTKLDRDPVCGKGHVSLPASCQRQLVLADHNLNMSRAAHG